MNRVSGSYLTTMISLFSSSSEGYIVRLVKKGLALLMALCCVMSSTASAQSRLPTLGDVDREEMSPAAEYKLGVEIMQKIRNDPDYVKDVVLLEYLNSLGNRLLSANAEVRADTGYDFYFFAVRDSTLNAFALPGGFIGVHTGLLITAQSESELASVMSHEIGHVSQRHIARMLSKQRQDILIPIAAAALAIVASRSNSDAAGAIMLGGQGLAVQRQLNFSRDAEREADRVGFQILKDARFDTSGMPSFFNRLLVSSRGYSDNTVSVYLRTHPLTTERIADIESRVRSQPYRQHPDTLDFYLMRARARLLQAPGIDGQVKASTLFEEQAAKGTRQQMAAAHYGLALVALQQNQVEKARAEMQRIAKLFPDTVLKNSVALTHFSIELKLAEKRPAEALKEAQAAITRFPTSRAMVHVYADTLMANQQYAKVITYLRNQAQTYRDDATIRHLLAKAYDFQGKRALMHLNLAEAYHQTGALSSALEQLTFARKSPDVTFYDLSIIDAWQREWQKERLEQLQKK